MKSYTNNLAISFGRLKTQFRASMTIAILLLLTLFITQTFSFVGSFLSSLVIILSISFLINDTSKSNLSSLQTVKKISAQINFSKVFLAIFTTPALLLLHSTQDLAYASSMNLISVLLLQMSFIWIILFALLLTYSPLSDESTKEKKKLSFEASLKRHSKKWKIYLTMSLIYTLIILAALLPLGMGLIIAIPLLMISASELYQQATP